MPGYGFPSVLTKRQKKYLQDLQQAYPQMSEEEVILSHEELAQVLAIRKHSVERALLRLQGRYTKLSVSYVPISFEHYLDIWWKPTKYHFGLRIRP